MTLYKGCIVTRMVGLSLLQHFKRFWWSAVCLVDSCGLALHLWLMQQAYISFALAAAG